jgi:hypothetical protein
MTRLLEYGMFIFAWAFLGCLIAVPWTTTPIMVLGYAVGVSVGLFLVTMLCGATADCIGHIRDDLKRKAGR